MEKILYIIKSSAKGSLYALLFLALIQPFGIDQLKEGRIEFIISESVLAFISIAISFYLTSLILPHKKEKATMKGFLIYNAVLYAINTPLLATMLLTYNGWFNFGSSMYFWFQDGQFVLHHHLPIMSMYVSCLSLFIFLYELYSFRNNKLKNELEEIRAINALLEKRQEKLQQEESESCHAENNDEESQNNETPSTITIVGQGQGATLEVDPKNIIYVESMANYASICYISNNETKIATLRITLKQIRETLEDIDCIVQCHRAFLVNINFVVSLNNNNSNYQLQMFGMDKHIPVSRANTEAIKLKLSK